MKVVIIGGSGLIGSTVVTDSARSASKRGSASPQSRPYRPDRLLRSLTPGHCDQLHGEPCRKSERRAIHPLFHEGEVVARLKAPGRRQAVITP
jgi:hypothetical protein